MRAGFASLLRARSGATSPGPVPRAPVQITHTALPARVPSLVHAELGQQLDGELTPVALRQRLDHDDSRTARGLFAEQRWRAQGAAGSRRPSLRARTLDRRRPAPISPTRMRMTVAAWRPSAPSMTIALPSGSGSSRKSGGVTRPSVPRGKSFARCGDPGFRSQGGEEAIPEGVDGYGWGVPREIAQRSGVPATRTDFVVFWRHRPPKRRGPC
jgi:hypothetical protein